jgi:hypothetical protein
MTNMKMVAVPLLAFSNQPARLQHTSAAAAAAATSGITLPATLPGLTLPSVAINGVLQLATNLGLTAAQTSASGSSTAVAAVDSMDFKDVVAQWLAGGAFPHCFQQVVHNDFVKHNECDWTAAVAQWDACCD